ncbi:hypothetical protein L596_023956 [Steinernema carpocapsae]|uniref:SXP/RAL-2 family protein Ani s 5-like cation-binding domain-containing protein n=1 Tax=Steinernema carpocapsae TaxID=34508 RepID=A0A4U5MFA5_STECR|nr:hypothetical protein L596_023956 [Steinernema carpocapsae]
MILLSLVLFLSIFINSNAESAPDYHPNQIPPPKCSPNSFCNYILYSAFAIAYPDRFYDSVGSNSWILHEFLQLTMDELAQVLKWQSLEGPDARTEEQRLNNYIRLSTQNFPNLHKKLVDHKKMVEEFWNPPSRPLRDYLAHTNDRKMFWDMKTGFQIKAFCNQIRETADLVKKISGVEKKLLEKYFPQIEKLLECEFLKRNEQVLRSSEKMNKILSFSKTKNV